LILATKEQRLGASRKIAAGYFGLAACCFLFEGKRYGNESFYVKDLKPIFTAAKITLKKATILQLS